MGTRDPLLARFTTSSDGYRNATVSVHGGLHYLRGNSSPHFSLTCDIYEGGRDVGGGAAHELILKGAPHLAPLARMHLSDMDGKPMHSSANAFYWLAGACVNGLGQRYHGGNSDPKRSADDCLRIFADHVRIPIEQAHEVRAMVQAAHDAVPFYARTYEGKGGPVASAALAEWCEAQHVRWANEARECIDSLKLQVFGDTWAPK